MVYAATIIKASRDYGGKNWLTYNYRFRQLAAARKTETGWGQKDLGLRNKTFIKPKYQDSQDAEDTESPPARLGYHSAPKKRSGDGSYSLPSSKKPPSTALKKSAEKGWRSHICYTFSYSGKRPKERCEYPSRLFKKERTLNLNPLPSITMCDVNCPPCGFTRSGINFVSTYLSSFLITYSLWYSLHLLLII